jgi:hypothetical protein
VGRPERRARAYFDPDAWEEDLARTTAAASDDVEKSLSLVPYTSEVGDSRRAGRI